ncbi:MAG TPA: hypothetical protein VGB81_01000 [Devosia sp.]
MASKTLKKHQRFLGGLLFLKNIVVRRNVKRALDQRLEDFRLLRIQGIKRAEATDKNVVLNLPASAVAVVIVSRIFDRLHATHTGLSLCLTVDAWEMKTASRFIVM